MTAPSMTSSRKVPTRRMAFEDALAHVPKHFAAEGDLMYSHVIAALSSLFPDGEDFFVRSVRRFRSEITDPELKRQVNGFIGQEAMHGREHRAFNDRLSELGFPTKGAEQFVRWLLREKDGPIEGPFDLAITAALEHYTATLAEAVLRDESLREAIGDETVRDLFVWHALEESEHKAVAFDVYRAAGGSELMRRIAMRGVSIIFPAVVLGILGVSLARDPAAYRVDRLIRSVIRFRKSPLIDSAVRSQIRTYYAKGFHPDDQDTSALEEEWRTRLFGQDGTLNDKLVGSAA